MKYYLVIIILIILPNACKKEEPITEPLYKTFKGQIGTNDNSTIVSSDNNLVICGSSYYGNIYIIKLSKTGHLIWRKDLYKGNNSWASGLAESNNHDLFICGATHEPGSIKGYDVLLIKLNSNGDTIWTKSYGGSDLESGSQIINTNDNNLLICGSYFTNMSTNWSDVFLLKVNYDGDTLWTKTYTDSLYQMSTHLLQTKNNDYLITGQNSDLLGYKSLYLVKVNSDGDKLWDKKIGPTTGKIAYSAIELSNGDLILCGSNASNHYRQVLFAKTDNLGNEYWEKEIDQNIFRGEGYVIKQDIGGTYTIVGAVTDANDGRAGILLLKVDENCNILMYKIFGVSQGNWGANLIKDTNDDNIITGNYNGSIFMIKTDKDGEYYY